MLDKFHGCLIIKANGDVLGYHLEFIHKKEIFEKWHNRISAQKWKSNYF